MNRIVVPHLPDPGGRVQVDAPGSHHLLRVQRVARGAEVAATDAAGRRARCVLLDGSDGVALLEVVDLRPVPRLPARLVLLGIPRGPALEEALTLGTEAGATGFRLVAAQRSPPGQVRLDRLDRVLRAAVTQCGRADTPLVQVAPTLSAALDGLPPLRLLAAPGASAPPAPTPDAGVVAVGPEGGWTPEEAGVLEGAGFLPVDLGPFVLRTPTAVAAALARLWPGAL